MHQGALDAIDIRILTVLQQHGQISKSALAERISLSATACWTRVSRLKKLGLIKGYHADIDVGKITDLVKVVVTVSLKRHRKVDFENFENRVCTISQIVECVATGGGSDYVMTVISSNLTEFQTLMEQLLSEDIGIERYITYITTRTIKKSQPDLLDLLSAHSN